MRKSALSFTALSVVGMLTLLATSLPAQDAPPVSKLEAKPATRAYNPARRVPPYFGQIGLTPEQRERIYAIRGEYQATIADLKRQIEEAEAREMADCESVLTEAQRSLLYQRRAARKGSVKSSAPVVAPPGSNKASSAASSEEPEG